MKENDPSWYQSWFNTPYYHLLYQNRNNDEAMLFLDNLCVYLDLPPKAKTWDMACGKGRHAVYLSQKGFSSYGTDLSEKNIEEASATKKENLTFYVHDMRSPIRINYFDCVLNIFTSLGYFEHRRDDERVFISAFQSCKKEGYFVLDFLNAEKAKKKLIAEETKEIGGIKFHIKKRVEEERFIKEISFEADGRKWNFEEKVSAYGMSDLLQMGTSAGFELENSFGDYSLSKFEESESDRLILIFRK